MAQGGGARLQTSGHYEFDFCAAVSVLKPPLPNIPPWKIWGIVPADKLLRYMRSDGKADFPLAPLCVNYLHLREGIRPPGRSSSIEINQLQGQNVGVINLPLSLSVLHIQQIRNSNCQHKITARCFCFSLSWEHNSFIFNFKTIWLSTFWKHVQSLWKYFLDVMIKVLSS